MIKFNRAIRRHHRNRLRNNRKDYHGGLRNRKNPEMIMSFYVNTPTPCSCTMCGNPRKWFKYKTLSEMKCEDSTSEY